MVTIGKYVACIVEGGAESAVIDILLENDLLIFSREQMLDERTLRNRSASDFTRSYLNKKYKGKITVLRILDSRNTAFKISKPYDEKIDNIYDIVTAPEIEMLIILAENKYREWKSSGKKPSEFCKSTLKLTHVKQYDFIKSYFLDAEKLLRAISDYVRYSHIPAKEECLCSLIKESALRAIS